MDFEAKKSLGQNFLTSDVVPKWMCDAAGDLAGKTVLEIGPGTGALTKEILARGAQVIAVEADTRAIEALTKTFTDEIQANTLTIHHLDARLLTPETLGLTDHTYICIANIPYYLSGFLFRTLLESMCQPATLVFLVQKEVAERIARDKKESILSLSVKAFGKPRYVKTVSRGHFKPQPKIDSAIIAISAISRNNFTTITPNDFFSLLHLGFGQKRKQLLGNLSKQYDRPKIQEIFTALSIEEQVRAEDVPLEKWLALTHKITTSHSTIENT